MYLNRKEEQKAEKLYQAIERWNREINLFPFRSKPVEVEMIVMTRGRHIFTREINAAWERLLKTKTMEG